MPEKLRQQQDPPEAFLGVPELRVGWEGEGWVVTGMDTDAGDVVLSVFPGVGCLAGPSGLRAVVPGSKTLSQTHTLSGPQFL